jgi:hypothetical protein
MSLTSAQARDLKNNYISSCTKIFDELTKLGSLDDA